MALTSRKPTRIMRTTNFNIRVHLLPKLIGGDHTVIAGKRGSIPRLPAVTSATWAGLLRSINQQNPTVPLGRLNSRHYGSSTQVSTHQRHGNNQHHRLHRFHGTIHGFLHIGECGCGKVPRPRPHPVSSSQTSPNAPVANINLESHRVHLRFVSLERWRVRRCS
jgi:hypothetical protein